MTILQRLQLEQSELREDLSRILGIAAADRSDEDKATLSTNTTRLREIEPEIRAAIVASPEETGTVETVDAETRERRALRARVTLSGHVSAAMEQRSLEGAELEFNQALGLRAAGAFPLELLAPEVEHRATTDTDSAAMQRPWLDRLFADTAAMRLGITFESVSPGVASFPIVTAGASAAQRGRTEAAADGAWTVGVSDLKPSRNSVRAIFSEEDAMRLPGLEEALRRDLGMALTEGVDRVVFVGDTGANEAAGDIKGLTTITDVEDRTISQANKILGEGVLGAFAALIDGKRAVTTADLNVVLSVGSYRLWLATKNGNHGAIDTTILEFLRRAGLNISSRGEIETATAADDWAGFCGLKRGLRGAGVAAVWNSGLLVRDPYSNAAKGQVALTLSYFWNFGLPRPTNFARLKFVA